MVLSSRSHSGLFPPNHNYVLWDPFLEPCSSNSLLLKAARRSRVHTWPSPLLVVALTWLRTHHTTENVQRMLSRLSLVDLCQNSFGTGIQEPNYRVTGYVHFSFFFRVCAHLIWLNICRIRKADPVHMLSGKTQGFPWSPSCQHRTLSSFLIFASLTAVNLMVSVCISLGISDVGHLFECSKIRWKSRIYFLRLFWEVNEIMQAKCWTHHSVRSQHSMNANLLKTKVSRLT